MQANRRFHRFIRFPRLVFVFTYCFTLQQLLICFPMPARANPTGGQVVAGQATIQPQGSTLTVTQGTNRAVINWQGFSIGNGETTRFSQPSSDSAILNRVTGFGPSQLDGSLTANGQVFLINPNGAVIGPGGRIETNGFFASTLHIADTAFMAGGDLNFSGDSLAGIRNLGLIRASAGDIILAARTVENAGTLQAPQGTVGLAATNEVLYRPTGSDRIFVKSALALPEETDGVTNTGLIEAAQAELKAAGGDVYSLAVNNGGVIHATGVTAQDGRVLLTSSGGAVSTTGVIAAVKANGDGGEIRLQAEGDGEGAVTVAGRLDATGASQGTTGGNITVTGNRVALTGTARVDASGDAGGGLVRIGGDYQGRNPEIANARETTVAEGAEIRADALTGGDGGRVILWSDEATRFEGSLSARGGSLSGNGGFAEISGGWLSFKGLTDFRAPQGLSGKLLLDPDNVYISDLYEHSYGEPISYLHPTIVSGVLEGGSLEIWARKTIFYESGQIAWTSPNTLYLNVDPQGNNNGVGISMGVTAPPGANPIGIHAPNGGLYLRPWGRLDTLDSLVIDVAALTIQPVTNPLTDIGHFSISGKVVTPSLTLIGTDGSMCLDCSFRIDNAENSLSSIVIGDGSGPLPNESFVLKSLPGNFIVRSKTSISAETKGWVAFQGNATFLTDGDLTLNNFIGFHSYLYENQLVLSAAGKFINAGAAPTFNFLDGFSITSHFPLAKRVLLFSADPRLDTRGDFPGAETGLAMNGRIYDKGYADLGAIPEGNWFVYSLAPTVTITALDAAKTYGEDNPDSTWKASTGLIEGDSLTGKPAFTATATERSDVGSYELKATGIGNVSGPSGYRFVFDPVPATLTVNKRQVAIALSELSRQYGEENPSSFPAVYTGLTDWDKDPLTGEPLAGVLNRPAFYVSSSIGASRT